MIGLMVGLLLAGLIGLYIWRSHATAPSDSNPNPVVRNADGTVYGVDPGGVGDTGLSYGGTTFITQQGASSAAAAKGGATAYDVNDPATAQRRLDAINGATAMAALAAQQGLSADQLYQAHLAHELDPNTPTNSKAPIGNAQRWDSTTQTWVPITADPRTTQWSF